MKKYLFLGTEEVVIGLLKKEKQLKRLVEEAKRLSEEKLTKEHPKGSSTFMGMGAINLSLTYLLTKQEKFLNQAKRWLLTGVGYKDWGHAHLVNVDLSASWLLFGYSLSFDWLRDYLSKEEKELIETKLLRQARIMYEYAIKEQGDSWSTNYWQNHNWINFTGLAAAGYLLRKKYPEANEWIEHCKKNFEIVFDAMPEDGSDYEGVVYWRYGASWLFIAAHLFKTQGEKDYYRTNEFLKNTFYYRLYQSTAELDEIINFGDCHDRRSGHSAAVYYKVASEYDNGHAQKLGNIVVDKFLYREQYESKVKPGILPEAWLELLWYSSEVKEKEFDNLPLVKYWDDLGLLVVKSSWREDGVTFSFKCSQPGGKKQWQMANKLDKEKGWSTKSLGHQHADNNSFILHGFKEHLIIDEGYSREVKASDHNMILVDGQGYQTENLNDIWINNKIDEVGEVKDFCFEGDLTYICGEIAPLYKKSLNMTRMRRHLITSMKNYYVVIDELESIDEHNYSWNIHTDYKGKVENNKVVFDNLYSKMEILPLLPLEKEINFKETYVRAIMTTQEPDKAREITMATTEIVSPKSKKIVFVNIINIEKKNNPKNLEIVTKEIENGYEYEISNSFDDKKAMLRVFDKLDNLELEFLSEDNRTLILKNDKGEIK